MRHTRNPSLGRRRHIHSLMTDCLASAHLATETGGSVDVALQEFLDGLDDAQYADLLPMALGALLATVEHMADVHGVGVAEVLRLTEREAQGGS